MSRDIKEIISKMTLEEKASLCSGLDMWHTKAVERLQIPSIMMTDGPHGLRKQGEPTSLDIYNSVPATCFPSAAGLACSWDRSLLKKVGVALGEECQAEKVDIILGPGANIKRSPLCGRNFEYFSEDPYLTSEMAANHIEGVQSQGVGTSLKHFAVNNQENRRMSVSAVVDERTFREIYLSNFEGAVKKAKPWTVMCSYNRVNGTYSSENKNLLTSILKDEWGHEGIVMSDWGAVNERAAGLLAGLELEMPSSGGSGDKKIVEAVKNGEIKEEVLDKAVERLLKIIFKAVENRKENAVYDKEAHHRLAKEVVSECMVLLKNEDNILPLEKKETIAIIGDLAEKPRYQGGGSSHINPSKLDNIYVEIKKAAGENANILYAAGYNQDVDDIDEKLVNEAKKTASKADKVVIFAGLPERYESEGFDRSHMRMPENQLKLIDAIAEVQKNIIVVLSNGAPIEMPWLGKVKAVLEAYLGGQALGGAIAELLFGDAVPCGKLAETFPKKLSDNPSYLNFPGEGDTVEYREGLFVGYRYYDKKQIEPLFPFGYGLSYTTFEYSNITADKEEISDKDTVKVSVNIKNTGKVSGKEIVQLYVRDVESSVIRPDKELKGFEKVELKPGEEKTVCFTLDKRSFAYYNVDIKDWYVESGVFEILIGISSEDIKLKKNIEVKSTARIKNKFTRNSLLKDIMDDASSMKKIELMISSAPKENEALEGMIKFSEGVMGDFIRTAPLRTLVSFSAGAFTEEAMNKILEVLNK